MSALRFAAPWMHLDLGGRRRVLSFAPHRPGFVQAARITWRQVRNSDLGPDLDATRWLRQQLGAAGIRDCVAMMTSHDLTRAVQRRSGPVQCVATVGLGNAGRIGQRSGPARGYGTINIALVIGAGLSRAAQIEALAQVAAARTAAVMDAGLALPGGLTTGTGTDCIAIAANRGRLAYAGLHTDLGFHLGRAAYQAVRAGADDWIARQGSR